MERLFGRLLLLIMVLIQSCGGGGGSGSISSQSPSTPTPLTVDASSFINKGAADLANFRVPDLWYIAGTGGYRSIPDTLAVADFQRTGQYSAFVVGKKTVSTTTYVRAFFLKYDPVQNVWGDISAELFNDPALDVAATDRVVCDDPRQGLVTKFNADERPDVYVVCADVLGGGVPQKMYISSGSGGKYVRYETNFLADAASASIAQLDADQNVDIVTTHQGLVARVLGTGGFGSVGWLATLQPVNDFPGSRFPSSNNSVFLIPRNGDVYLLVGGYGSGQNEIVAFKTDSGFMIQNSYRHILVSTTVPEYKIDYAEFEQRGYVFAVESVSNINAQVYWIAPPFYQPPSTWSSQVLHTLGGGPYANPSGSWPSRVVIQKPGQYPTMYVHDAGCLANPVQLSTDLRCGSNVSLNPSSFTPPN